MSPVFRIRVWCCTLLIAASGVNAQDTKLSKASSRNEREADLQLTSVAKKPACVISIPEDEADGLTKLLNGFLNVFAKTDPPTVDTSPDAGSSFVLDCVNGVSGLETSVWRILNRVWLAASCQYADDEFEQALREVEREADQVQITLRNAGVKLRNITVKEGYYNSTVTSIRATLIQVVKKMKEVQNSGRCYFSAVKQLTANFEEALREIKSQKETIAVLQEETRQALAAISTLKGGKEKSVLAVKTPKAETEMLLQVAPEQKNDTDIAPARIIPDIQAIESQRGKIEDLRSVFDNQTLKTAEGFSAVESVGEHLSREIEELKTKDMDVEETLVTQGEELAESKANISHAVSKQAEKGSEQDEFLEKLKAKVFPPELNATVAPLLEEMSTVAPALTALQVYLSSGFAGLIGKSLNIENEHYKGDFLYLARNPMNRTANVYFDGATLAVGEDKLRERAFQWELLPIPGEDDSVVYLRNKLNHLQPMAEDESGRFNYIRMRTVFSPTVGEPSQLVIAMKATFLNEYYFPYSTPNIKSELNGQEIGWSTTTNYPGRRWIVTLASEKLSSTVHSPQESDSTVAFLPEEASTFEPPTALQACLSYGLAGLTGKPLNIENEHYKREFLYLARNATNRSANIYFDGATLAVGEAELELRESAYQWEFVGVPGEDSSVVYLRNKLNELKPIPSRQDQWGGWDYVSIKTVSSGTRREPSQLVITMKETVENKHYYRPNPTPNSNSELNGREIGWDLSRNYPSTKWIVTFAS